MYVRGRFYKKNLPQLKKRVNYLQASSIRCYSVTGNSNRIFRLVILFCAHCAANTDKRYGMLYKSYLDYEVSFNFRVLNVIEFSAYWNLSRVQPLKTLWFVLFLYHHRLWRCAEFWNGFWRNKSNQKYDLMHWKLFIHLHTFSRWSTKAAVHNVPA